jgi:enoyl-CoA hydratase
MSEQFVRYEKDGDIAVVTIDRPKALNALNAEVLAQLKGALQEALKDKAVRGVVLTGSGEKAFVAGADIAHMVNLSPAEGLAFAELGLSVLRFIEEMPIPVAAAVNGFALGGGTELALACDMIYAAPNAKFGQPEVKLGIIPGFGGTQRLSRLLGRNRAKELIFTGDIIDAATAEQYGLVQKVVPLPELLDYAKKKLRDIAARGPLAVRQAKFAINEGVDLPLDSGLAVEKLAFMCLFASQDQKEGMKAFLEKRNPQFKGE